MKLTHRPTGFTLIELLLVIVIIGILVALTLTVGSSAMTGGRGRQTADTIRVIDAAVETYSGEVGKAPPAFVVAFAPGTISDPLAAEDFAAYPMADAVDATDGDENRTVINSVGLFIKAAEDAGLGDLFAGLSADVLVRWDGDGDVVESSGDSSDFDRQPELRTILDAWGRPIRFVHPAWDGIMTVEDNEGQVRSPGEFGTPVRPITGDDPDNGYDFWLPLTRSPEGFNPLDEGDFPIRLIRRDRLTEEDRAGWDNNTPINPIGDADGGYAVGGRPYAYSAGADGDPSTTDDNVYTTVPRFAVE
ncbi:MAG: type II secretion system GspH family protein [Phycisphaerales bacterium]|nr:type II secretion system GspH family protein [Phycisphaerales bacterium]